MFPFTPRPEEQASGITQAGLRPAVTVVTARPEEPQQDVDQDVLEEAQLRFRRSVIYESKWRKEAEDELNFLNLEHWDIGMREERKGRPCLTFDRIGPSIDQVVNDARQSPPEPRFNPVGGRADKKTAELLQGLWRNIEQDSGAEIAYMTAYEPAVQVGRGWFRLTFDFENDDSFLQKLIIQRVPNPFSIYPDPAAVEWDYSDMRYCFVTEDLEQELFTELYPDAEIAQFAEGTSADPVRSDWYPGGAVRVAEYWRVLTSEKELLLLSDGRTVKTDQNPDNLQVVSRRKVRERRIEGFKISGAQVLERWDWPGKWIPIIPVLGKEILKKGKRTLRGMVRPAMDANLSYDYMRSKQVEAVGLAPIAPYLVEESQLEGHESQWADANRKAYAFLKYKVRSAGGEPLPPPTRQNQEPAIAAITSAVQFADNDVKASLSTYDASLGNAGPESSGRAIMARQREADNAHFNYHDNLGRSLRHAARVGLDLIPHIYSEERIISIYDPDGSIRQVEINKEIIEDGVSRIYRIGQPADRYDVTLGSGPSYATRRQQGAQALLEMTSRAPILIARAGDLVIKALDIPFGDEIADRIRPPDVQSQQDGAAPIPPQVQAQMAQQAQLIKAMGARLNELSQLIENKKLELDSKERIAAQGNETAITVAALKAHTDQALQMMREEFASVHHRLEMLLQTEGSAAGAPTGGSAGAPPAPGLPAPGAVPQMQTA